MISTMEITAKITLLIKNDKVIFQICKKWRGFMQKFRKKGVALVTVIIIMGILVILGTALLSVGVSETKNASWEKSRVQAHYLGRSGVYVGLDLIKNKLNTKIYSDLGVLASELNTQVASLNTSATAFKIGESGKFSLNFESTEPGEVKIKSTGITAGSPNSTELVTYIVKINTGVSMTLNPTEWVNGINLIKGIASDTNYLGKGVMFEGKPVQSPQGSRSSSIYQASILHFRNYTQAGQSLSFKQVTNSIPITFDAEVIYFESGVMLNKTKDPVALSMTDPVMSNRIGNIAYSGIVGFENYARYSSFIGTNTSDLYSTYSSQFDPAAKYGIVYFGGDVLRDDDIAPVLDKGYYFFKSGVDLHNRTAGETGSYKNFIKLPDDDAAIKALNAMFRQSPSSSGYIWNKK